MDEPTVTIPLSDYRRLLEAAESDEDIVWCEVCGAWLAIDDPARAPIDGFIGCWKLATDSRSEQELCRSYRATVIGLGGR